MKAIKKLALFATAGSVFFAPISCLATSENNAVDSKHYDFVTPSGIKSQNIESAIDDLMSKFINKNISGAQVSVTKDGKEVFSKGYGLASRKTQTTVDTNTSFNYASVSKLFIWVSAMQLVEQGKLDINKDIRTYLPKGYPLHITSKKPVTFLNLMNHNAGFEAYWTHYSGSGMSRDFSSLEEAVRKCYSTVQCFEPGEFQGYSNVGANLGALIIEKISKTPYLEYVEKNIFKPCNMNTCYPERKPIEKVMENKAVGYRFNGKKFKLTTVYSGDWLYPSGSAVGTANDLSKFAKALMPAKGKKSPLFKNNKTLEEMFKISYTPTGKDLFSMHHGFWGPNGNYSGVGHTGCVNGMVSHFVIVPKERFSVAVLVNDENGWDIAYGVTSLLTGSEYNKNRPKFDKVNTKTLEGSYVHARTRFANRTRDFDLINVKSLENGQDIELKANNNSQIYRQIRPYLFENITSAHGIDYKSKIYFKIKNGSVEKIVTFKNDLIPISKLKKFRSKFN